MSYDPATWIAKLSPHELLPQLVRSPSGKQGDGIVYYSVESGACAVDDINVNEQTQSGLDIYFYK